MGSQAVLPIKNPAQLKFIWKYSLLERLGRQLPRMQWAINITNTKENKENKWHLFFLNVKRDTSQTEFIFPLSVSMSNEILSFHHYMKWHKMEWNRTIPAAITSNHSMHHDAAAWFTEGFLEIPCGSCCQHEMFCFKKAKKKIFWLCRVIPNPRL